MRDVPVIMAAANCNAKAKSQMYAAEVKSEAKAIEAQQRTRNELCNVIDDELN